MNAGGARVKVGHLHPQGMWFGSAQGVPHAPPQFGPAERLARINSACVQLVEGDVGLGSYATFSSVLSRFCQRAGVGQFEQLGLGPPVAVPCLRYLWDLQVSLPGLAQLLLSLPLPPSSPLPPFLLVLRTRGLAAPVRASSLQLLSSPCPAPSHHLTHPSPRCVRSGLAFCTHCAAPFARPFAGNRGPLHPHLHFDARYRHAWRSGIRARGPSQLLLRPLSALVPGRNVSASAGKCVVTHALPIRSRFRRRRQGPTSASCARRACYA